VRWLINHHIPPTANPGIEWPCLKKFPKYEVLMNQCWHREPQQRPSFKSIVPELEKLLRRAEREEFEEELEE